MARPFQGRTLEWLESELELAQEDLSAGKTLTSTSAGDASAGMERVAGATPEARISKLKHELSFVDIAKYPASQNRRVTRTIARIYG